MHADNTAEFGKWRAFFWPIHRWELKKFIPMLFIFFLISFNYNALRAYKDSMVVTAPESGAEAIPFIKVWAILPCAILLTYLFTRLANRFNREKVFYIMMSLFLAFFFIFTFVLFPAQEYLHPTAFADKLQAILPSGFKGMIAIFRNWTFTLFYVMSELWGTAIMSVLFWGFANEVTPVKEAKRYYGLLAIGANVAGTLSGQISIFFSGNIFLPWLPYGKDAWEQSILFLNCTIIFSGIVTIALFRWLNRHVIMSSHENSHAHHREPEKVKMSMRKNFAYLAKSKYLICIALIVLTYNIAINLIEVVWKNQIKQIYPNPSEYSVYMGEVMTVMGIIATTVAIFVTGNLIRRFSWTFTALISPAITLLTGIGFFSIVLCEQSGSWIAAVLGTAPIMLSVTLGSLQNCMTRACKYTVFDATKEIAFIPLSNESKLKGKAAIDGVGSRLGKSGGSVIHQGLLLIFTTVAASTPYVAVIFLVVALVWILSVLSLGRQFDSLVTDNAKLEISDAPTEPEPILAK